MGGHAGRSDLWTAGADALHNDYVARATRAQVAIGAPAREETFAPRHDTDADGAPLDGRGQRYTLRLGKDALPPLAAFWSLTIYPAPGHRHAADALPRYRIDSTRLPHLPRDADGSLTLHLQHPIPAHAQRANWLPIPDGPFVAVMRYYWPPPALLDTPWMAPAMERARRQD
ncbi:DUF1214 domain-containing protein [Stenotrophomonas sp.]|uniref:DUF1214 domain-containing protein n=1 Tax=Stenotrophomonas sp. TaxID=69392 RepID=UPI002FC5C71B